jgi:hypothetical protein
MVISLNRKGLTAQVIDDNFVATLGTEAKGDSAVANNLQPARIIPRDAIYSGLPRPLRSMNH